MRRHHHLEEVENRTLVVGKPNLERCDNKISTSKYTLLTFLPIAVSEQFRRVANMYFLVMGFVMAIGWYTDLFESAIFPWTIWGPLAIVLSFSLTQEGMADIRRHKSDEITNNYKCTILRRADELEAEGGSREMSIRNGEAVKVSLETQIQGCESDSLSHIPTVDDSSCCEIAFQAVKRKDIRQGQIVLVRNRDMIPADLILLASSADNGSVYVETMSIDGETNLKLRTSPRLPEIYNSLTTGADESLHESLEQATTRVCRLSALGFPDGTSALDNPSNPRNNEVDKLGDSAKSGEGIPFVCTGKEISADVEDAVKGLEAGYSLAPKSCMQVVPPDNKLVAVLTSEPPNASVNTFNGVLWLPPMQNVGPSLEIALNAENILLRGAVLRNTEWAIGLACYTGDDTKLVRNSIETPSKFSRLDQLTNSIVYYVIGFMMFCNAVLASCATYTNNKESQRMRYLGVNADATETWPTLPNLAPPKWASATSNWLQIFLLFVTLLNQFLPLSLYITVEFITIVSRIFINIDVNMYDPDTDTRTVARSTTVSDLGQVEYIFSDKTGTLTQNVMTFKRCSVDGMVFGEPIGKTTSSEEGHFTHQFHALERLLSPSHIPVLGLNKDTPSAGPSRGETLPNETDEIRPSGFLSFNAEMFLRVMSLCHTVVVEKDLDAKHGVISASQEDNGNGSTSSHRSSYNTLTSVFQIRRAHSSLGSTNSLFNERSTNTDVAIPREQSESRQRRYGTVKGNDGAPSGLAFQAESPDEGALVEASSRIFGFQVVSRDRAGITLIVDFPSIFSDGKVVESVTKGSVTELELSASTSFSEAMQLPSTTLPKKTEEIWEVLAVNKFDSTRKRMSVLVRSPPELGSIPMLLCKGADSAMLNPRILRNPSHVMVGDEDAAEIAHQCEPEEFNEAEWDRTTTLSLQSHLGEFAREGLRTLVLGMRFLTEEECLQWLAKYNAAATSLKDRESKLNDAAELIETNIHIVGATAIEDKLQDGVAETIAMLGKAGIKLWVLTGDKRETAKEIGYATKVLTEKMRPGLVEIVQGSPNEVHTRMAMAFLKLVKYAKLPGYQKSALSTDFPNRFESFFFRWGKFSRRVNRALRRFYHRWIKVVIVYWFVGVNPNDPKLRLIDLEEMNEINILQMTDRRRNVRNRAEQIVRDYLNSTEGMAQRKCRTKIDPNVELPIEIMNLPPSDGPDVFNRASNADAAIRERYIHGLTAVNLGGHSGEFDTRLVDEDILSMKSFKPLDDEEKRKHFDVRKRTIWERAFAVDKDVRNGRLVKHLTREKILTVQGGSDDKIDVSAGLRSTTMDANVDGPRGLVIEGAALEMMLGDSELEEILFAVANTCDSVIACRVSPAQKANLVQLVRRYVVPEPVTLAIGDGANDVGMIQAAHVGVGISGKEGAQAVNASDFAIGQFRFLQDMILIHGRWNFTRLVTAILFSFYKNAVLVGCLIAFSRQTLFSGTPFFDQWNIATFNFVVTMPIWSLGAFDRCLDRDYIRKHPEVYTPNRRNELLKNRVLIRWVILTFVHVLTVYLLSFPALAVRGAGSTSAFYGLMKTEDPDRPGNGEAGDLKSVGFVAFTSLILLMGFKVLYEARSIINGEWPIFTCNKKTADSWLDRAPWTWLALILGSFLFFVGFMYLYEVSGQLGPSPFSDFTEIPYHAWHVRVLSWMSILLVPVAGVVFDVTGKVFGNLFFPTQTQIHVEIFANEILKKGQQRNLERKEARDIRHLFC